MVSSPVPSERIARYTLLGIIGFLGIGLGRVAQLELAPADELVDHLGRRTRVDKQLHWRGDIVDRRNRCLAMSKLGYAIAIDLKVLGDRMEGAGLLSESSDPEFVHDYGRAWTRRLDQVARTLAADLALDRSVVFEKLVMAGRNERHLVLGTGMGVDDPEFIETVRKLRIKDDEASEDRPIQGLIVEEGEPGSGYDLAIDLQTLGDGMEEARLLPEDLSRSTDRRLDHRHLEAWTARLDQVAEQLADELDLERAVVFEKMVKAGRNRRYLVLAPEVDADVPDLPRKIRGLRIQPESWRIQGLVLDERPIRKVIDDPSMEAIIGSVGAVDWSPPPEEYDRIESNLRVDVPRFMEWARRHHPEIEDPLHRLAEKIAAVLDDFFNQDENLDTRDTITPRIAMALEQAAEAGEPWSPNLPAQLLETRHRRRFRQITLQPESSRKDEAGSDVNGEETPVDGRPGHRSATPFPSVPREYILEFDDPEALRILRTRYPDQVGSSGIEWERNDTLRQRHGSLERTVAARGDTLYLESFERGRDGDAVQLTIDVNIQQIVRQRLEQAIEDHLAVGGWAVVADPRTGEILAAVDIFDNAEARERGGWVEGMLDPRRDQIGPAHGRSRIWTDAYEPGSTFKTIFWAWSRHLGRVGQDEKVNIGSNNAKYFGKRKIEYIGRDSGPTEWSTILLKSINTGFATIAQRVTNQELMEMCERFGVGAPTGINMGVDRNGPDRSRLGSSPSLALLERSATGERLSMSFGYSVSLTPLQLVRAYCAIARNDGRLPLMSIVSPEVRAFETPSFTTVHPEIVLETRTVLTEQFEKVRERVEKNGGKPIPYTAFGKSGSAYLPRRGEDGGPAGYHKDPLPPRYLSSYVAGAPFDDPRIVVAVGIQDPLPGQGANADIEYPVGTPIGHLGSYSAGRPAHDIIGSVLEMLGVPADRVEVAAVQSLD